MNCFVSVESTERMVQKGGDNVEITLVFAALAFAVNKTVSVVKALGKDWNMVVTQVVVWVTAFIALLVASVADITEAYALPGFVQPLGELNVASVALLAWMLGGSGSFAYDFKKALDGTDSASEPALLSTVDNGPQS